MWTFTNWRTTLSMNVSFFEKEWHILLGWRAGGGNVERGYKAVALTGILAAATITNERACNDGVRFVFLYQDVTADPRDHQLP